MLGRLCECAGSGWPARRTPDPVGLRIEVPDSCQQPVQHIVVRVRPRQRRERARDRIGDSVVDGGVRVAGDRRRQHIADGSDPGSDEAAYPRGPLDGSGRSRRGPPTKGAPRSAHRVRRHHRRRAACSRRRPHARRRRCSRWTPVPGSCVEGGIHLAHVGVEIDRAHVFDGASTRYTRSTAYRPACSPAASYLVRGRSGTRPPSWMARNAGSSSMTFRMAFA